MSMPLVFEEIHQLAEQMKMVANTGWVNYGTCEPHELEPYTRMIAIGELTVIVMFSRDAGHHSGGWFKNPDYEYCYHLSLSYRGSDGDPLNSARRLERAPQMHRLSEVFIKAFYDKFTHLVWAEPPFSKIGKKLQVWHYRVFTNERWQPMHPRGEVYTTEFTEKGWKSYSELYGRKPDTVTTID